MLSEAICLRTLSRTTPGSHGAAAGTANVHRDPGCDYLLHSDLDSCEFQPIFFQLKESNVFVLVNFLLNEVRVRVAL